MNKLKSHRDDADLAFDKAVGARIRGFRMSSGMNQATLARAAGITFQQLQKYEKGTNRVAVSRLAAMARALCLPPSVLLGEIEGVDPVLSGSQRRWLDLHDRITPEQRDLVQRMFEGITRMAA